MPPRPILRETFGPKDFEGLMLGISWLFAVCGQDRLHVLPYIIRFVAIFLSPESPGVIRHYLYG